MVELTEIKEDIVQDPPVTPAGKAETSTELKQARVEEDDDSDLEDDFDQNETLMDRVKALKDIIPPQQRSRICNVFSASVSMIKSAFSKSSSLTWTITTSALLLGVPLSLSMLAEQQLIEMEKTFDLQKDANDILAQGDEKNSVAAA
ncbi:Mitochondrial import receptor subunit TOM22 [Nakaseomyces bracarensis]|uniref:Mitochondrial import receptor subunit TOM22 n=1 Tax=Nakaseomyces bracarensis TaxID=273131 RepID=A0ABR4NUR3_9SACH